MIAREIGRTGLRRAGALAWLSGLVVAALPSSATAQPKPAQIVVVGDSVRVYHPERVEGAVVVAEPLRLALRTAQLDTVMFLSEDLGRFEIYTGWVPRGPRIVEGTLIGLGAGVIPMLTLIGKCTDSCAAKGVTVLGTVGALLGGLIGGTTAGPQWRVAQLPPTGEPSPPGEAAARPGGPTSGAVYLTLARISF